MFVRTKTEICISGLTKRQVCSHKQTVVVNLIFHWGKVHWGHDFFYFERMEKKIQTSSLPSRQRMYALTQHQEPGPPSFKCVCVCHLQLQPSSKRVNAPAVKIKAQILLTLLTHCGITNFYLFIYFNVSGKFLSCQPRPQDEWWGREEKNMASVSQLHYRVSETVA